MSLTTLMKFLNLYCYFLVSLTISKYYFNISNIRMNHLILHENCLYSEIFWSVFSRIRTEYGKMQSISSYSLRMRENTDQKNSEQEHFSPSANVKLCFGLVKFILKIFFCCVLSFSFQII